MRFLSYEILFIALFAFLPACHDGDVYEMNVDYLERKIGVFDVDEAIPQELDSKIQDDGFVLSCQEMSLDNDIDNNTRHWASKIVLIHADIDSALQMLRQMEVESIGKIPADTDTIWVLTVCIDIIGRNDLSKYEDYIYDACKTKNDLSQLITMGYVETYLTLTNPSLLEFVQFTKALPRDIRLRSCVAYAKNNFNYIEPEYDGWLRRFEDWLRAEKK